jgi:hypothetical protein
VAAFRDNVNGALKALPYVISGFSLFGDLLMAHKTDKRNTLYANLMDEVKVRLDCISTVCNGRGGLPTVIIREFCYLQLRMICEVIALSCLVAHGDIAAFRSHKVGRSYSADDILERMEKLRPHFYPLPFAQTVKPNPPPHYEMRSINPSPLSKEELLSLYGLTHRYVHRGSLKQMLSMDVPIDLNVNVPEIIRWAQKINDLLSVHIISINEEHVMLCILRNADDNNKVQVATAEKADYPRPLAAQP